MINWIRKTAVWLWMTILFILSSIPSSELPDVHFVFGDKLLHWLVYSVLGYLAAWFYIPNATQIRQKILALRSAFFLGIAYGFFDEVHQLFVPGRNFDMWDWLFDMFGVITGILIFRYLSLKQLESES